MTMKRPLFLFLAGVFALMSWPRWSAAQWVKAYGFTGASLACLVADGPALYAGTSSPSFGVGIVLRSKDNGRSWESLNAAGWPKSPKEGRFALTQVSSLYIDGPKILAGTNTHGILASADGGASWTPVTTGLGYIGSVTSFTSTGAHLIAAVHSGVLISADGGNRWAEATSGLPGELIVCLAAIGESVFAGSFQGLFQSRDNGSTWQPVGDIPKGTDVKCLAAGRTNAFAGTAGRAYRSLDGGKTWVPLSLPFPGGVSSLAVSDQEVFAGSYLKGVFRSRDNGETWTEMNLGWSPETAHVLKLAVSGPYLNAVRLDEIWRCPLSGASGPPAESAAAYFANGQAAYRSGDWKNAVYHFSKAIELDPKVADAYFRRAWSYLEPGDKSSLDKALADVAKVLELSPDHKAVYYARGEAYRKRAYFSLDVGNKEEANDLLDRALADYQIALEAYPSSREMPVSMGHAHFAKGDLDRALAEYAKIFDQDPDFAQLADTLRMLFAAYGRQAREFDCGNSRAIAGLAAKYFMDERQYGQAVKSYSRAIELGDNQAHHYMRRSGAHEANGDLDAALADADTAFRLGKNPWTAEFRGRVHAVMGHWDEAIADYSRALKLIKFPSDSYKAEIYGKIAKAYQGKGDAKNADKYSARAEALKPRQKK
jgi:tetratricopeptide (TPR) repeat protein